MQYSVIFVISLNIKKSKYTFSTECRGGCVSRMYIFERFQHDFVSQNYNVNKLLTECPKGVYKATERN